jgi:hypothetical protein
MLRAVLMAFLCTAALPILGQETSPPMLLCEGPLAARRDWQTDQSCHFHSDASVIGPFDNAGDFVGGHAVVRLGAATYIIDATGTRVGLAELSDQCGLEIGEDGSFLRVEGDGCAIASLNAEVPPLPDGLQPQPQGIEAGQVVVRSPEGRYGIADMRASLLIPAEYEAVLPGEGAVANVLGDAGWRIVNLESGIVLPARFDDLGPFVAGHATASRGELSGIVDETGNWVVKPEYSWAEPIDAQYYYARAADGAVLLRAFNGSTSCELPAHTLWVAPHEPGSTIFRVALDAQRVGPADAALDRDFLGLDMIYGLVDANCRVLVPTTYYVLETIGAGEFIAARAVSSSRQSDNNSMPDIIGDLTGFELRYGIIDIEGTERIPFTLDGIEADPSGRLRALSFDGESYSSRVLDR